MRTEPPTLLRTKEPKGRAPEKAAPQCAPRGEISHWYHELGLRSTGVGKKSLGEVAHPPRPSYAAQMQLTNLAQRRRLNGGDSLLQS